VSMSMTPAKVPPVTSLRATFTTVAAMKTKIIVTIQGECEIKTVAGNFAQE